MNATQASWAIVLLGVIVLLLGANLFLVVEPVIIPRWEYQIMSAKDRELDKTLRDFGAEGWEVASARRAISKDELGGSEGIYECIMKRRRADR